MTTADAAERPDAAREGLLARHPLVFFFIFACAGTWLFSVAAALCEAGVGLLPVSSLLDPLHLYVVSTTLGVYLGPFLSAFVMTGATEGREGIRRLLHRIVLWRVGLRWYLFALVGFPAIIVLVASVLPGALASFQGLAPTIVTAYLFYFAYVFSIGGGLNEEVGWRGFALPRLQRLHGPLVGGLILGSLWALWHLPGFLIPPGSYGHTAEGYRPRLPRVRPRSDRPPSRHHVGLQQREGQRAHGHLGARFLEHLLLRGPDSALPRSQRARQLFEPYDCRGGVGAGARGRDPRPPGLPARRRTRSGYGPNLRRNFEECFKT